MCKIRYKMVCFFENAYCGYIEYIVCMKPNSYDHIILQLRNYTKMSCVKGDI